MVERYVNTVFILLLVIMYKMVALFLKITKHFEYYTVMKIDMKQAFILVFRDVFHQYVDSFPSQFLTFKKYSPSSRKQ